MGDISPGRQNSPILPEKVREDLKEEVTRCDSWRMSSDFPNLQSEKCSGHDENRTCSPRAWKSLLRVLQAAALLEGSAILGEAGWEQAGKVDATVC